MLPFPWIRVAAHVHFILYSRSLHLKYWQQCRAKIQQNVQKFLSEGMSSTQQEAVGRRLRNDERQWLSVCIFYFFKRRWRIHKYDEARRWAWYIPKLLQSSFFASCIWFKKWVSRRHFFWLDVWAFRARKPRVLQPREVSPPAGWCDFFVLTWVRIFKFLKEALF